MRASEIPQEGVATLRKGHTHYYLINKPCQEVLGSLLCLGVVRLFFGGSKVVSSRRLVEHGSVNKFVLLLLLFLQAVIAIPSRKKQPF